jgi:hypothetical protein
MPFAAQLTFFAWFAGGMAGRALDEALAFGWRSADEGIAAGGLSCFLRTRETIVTLAEQCARYAPRAFLERLRSLLPVSSGIVPAFTGLIPSAPRADGTEVAL